MPTFYTGCEQIRLKEPQITLEVPWYMHSADFNSQGFLWWLHKGRFKHWHFMITDKTVL